MLLAALAEGATAFADASTELRASVFEDGNAPKRRLVKTGIEEVKSRTGASIAIS